MIDSGFETKSVRMELLLLVSFQAPAADVDRIMEAVTAITPLGMGKYDSNAFQSAGGIERYRPLEGAAAGAETVLRERPGTVEVSFELADDQRLAERVVEAIYQAHSYQEPVIRIQPLLASRSKGLDDRSNPNRWWNTTGDWKKATASIKEDA
ncbi:hypothetical protein CN311_22365 [Mesorhizobium sanjuanii]|uniref:Nitrogen regulatory protein P-II n=1 Tax=Mesorhizobium sanjuanii TaxID=2037900 RepID=A0A2A6FBT2_9HYPH|nr:hypothetical protein [Mesorhizobium sanjuanii]PDQ18898.1 hypothetical protein CN311_22365 [Mesorhizobium sanjuanii]